MIICSASNIWHGYRNSSRRNRALSLDSSERPTKRARQRCTSLQNPKDTTDVKTAVINLSFNQCEHFFVCITSGLLNDIRKLSDSTPTQIVTSQRTDTLKRMYQKMALLTNHSTKEVKVN